MDLARSLPFLDKALQLSKQCGDNNQECQSLLLIASLKWRAGDPCSAKVHASEAQRLAKLSGNLFQEGKAYHILAACTRSVGNWQKSMADLRRARELLGLCGMSGGASDHEITIELAEIHLAKSEYAEARRLYSQMVEATSPDQNADAYAFALLNIAGVDIMIGQPAEDVDNNLSKAKQIFSSIEFLPGINFCDMFWAHIEFRVGKTANLLQTLHLAWGKEHQIMSFCLERLADVNAWQSARSQCRWPVVYLSYAYKTRDKLALQKALVFLGDVLISPEDGDTAQNLWVVALGGFTYMDVHCSRAQCMLRLGDLAKKRGEISTAIDFWKSARPLFERSLQAKDLLQINSRLVAIEKASQEALTKLATLHPPFDLLDQLSISNETRSGVEEVEEDEIGTDVAKAIVPIVV
jgi:tetratricopeptide (TPR) repeat protein